MKNGVDNGKAKTATGGGRCAALKTSAKRLQSFGVDGWTRITRDGNATSGAVTSVMATSVEGDATAVELFCAERLSHDARGVGLHHLSRNVGGGDLRQFAPC